MMTRKTQKTKKRSSTEIIESEEDPTVEHAYIKFPGEEIIPVTLKSDERNVFRDANKIWKILEKRGLNDKPRVYTDIHTHPGTPINFTRLIPGSRDFQKFLMDKEAKKMMIVQTDSETGKRQGYLVIKKTKDIRPYGHAPTTKDYGKILQTELKDGGYRHYREAFKSICKKYNLKWKSLPSKGYELDKEGLVFEEKHGKGLEGKVASITGISLLASIFFSSSTLTGFTIANLTPQTSNIIGITLFIIGLIASLYYFKRRKQTK